MIAAKAFDPVVGIDIHIIQPPGPVPPVPVPHPFVGMLIDPMDFAPIIGSTVDVNGMPRATAGTGGQCIPPHIPIGGVFVKPPGNECEVFMGSSTVLADGDPLSFLGMPALSCHDVGMPPPPRIKKKRKPKSLTLPTSVVLAVPAGAPVLVGGPPTISMMALGMKAAMAGLGKAFKKLKKLKAVKKALKKLKKAKQKAFKNMKPGFLKCKVLKAEPVNAVTGEVVVDQVDFELPWRIPLEWTRQYSSQSSRLGRCGYGWESPADARLELEADGGATFWDGTRYPTIFPNLPGPNEPSVLELVDGATLSRTDSEFVVTAKSGLSYRFPISTDGVRTLPLHIIRDRCGNWLEFGRDQDLSVEIRDATGGRLRFHDIGGRIGAVELVAGEGHPARILVQYEYDGSELAAVRDSLGAAYRFAYQSRHLVRHTDRNGLSFHYQYDGVGPQSRCIHTWGDGGLYDYHFEYQAAATVIQDSRGGVWTIDHQDGLPTAEVDPTGATTLYEYDDVGRTVAVVDPVGSRTEYEWDQSGNLASMTRPDGVSLKTTFGATHQAVELKDANGNAWLQAWDARGLLINQTTPRGASYSFAYDERGDLSHATDPLGYTHSFECDSRGNVTAIIDPLGNVTRFELDELANIVAITDPENASTRFQYDAKSRLVQVIHPSGRSEEFAYDAEDNLIRYRDENGGVTRHIITGLAETGQRINADGSVVTYEYDTEENLVAIINERNQRHEFRLDAVGRVVEEIDYWGHPLVFTYDPAGNLIEVEDAAGRRVRHHNDVLGRLVRKTYPDGSEDTFEYDPNGNLVQAIRAGVTVQRRYDEEDNLLWEATGGFVFESAYDPVGNRVRRTSSLGNVVDLSYDPLGEVAGIAVNGQPGTSIRRDRRGLTVQERFGAVLDRLYSYTIDGWLTRQATVRDGGIIHHREFGYDATGNVLERRDSSTGVTRFQYDPIGRVREFVRGAAEPRNYRRDPAGDLRQSTMAPIGKGRIEQYGDVTFRFDDVGNLVERKSPRGACRFDWDPNNWLVRATTEDASVWHYVYDALARRYAKASGDTRFEFGWDGDHLAIESAAGETYELVYYPDTFEIVVRVDSRGGHTYFDNDPAGAPHQLLDENGLVLWAGVYGPFGEVEETLASAVENCFRLQGQYWDSETGLHYNRNRYYDPAVGAFVSQDPLGTVTGENLYSYAPNAWRWIDPFGLACKKVPKWKGPCDYTGLKNHPSAGKGKHVTAAQKKKMYEANKKHNDGLLRDDTTGEVLVPPKKSKSGTKPKPNEAQVDHKKPRSKGGTNKYENLQILSRKNNRDKWDK